MKYQSSFTVNKARHKAAGRKLVSLTGIFFTVLFILGYIFAQHSAAANNRALQTYVVQPGDSLWKIAEAHSTPQQDLRMMVYRLQKMNRLTSPIIQPGQRLLLPTP